MNDAYNHKGTLEILSTIGETLVFIVYIQDKPTQGKILQDKVFKFVIVSDNTDTLVLDCF